MAVRTRDELLERVRGIVGERHDDDVIGLLEDMTDTYTDMETRLEQSGDWERKYQENDSEWRRKYRERFFGDTDEPELTGGNTAGESTQTYVYGDNEVEEDEPTTYEELFEEVK